MAKRRSKSRSRSGPDLAQLLRGEVIGGALVVLALLTMLSLLSANRGGITTALIGALQLVFGIGTWLVPILVGMLGAWLALHEVTDQRFLTSQRLAGAGGLFLVFEGVLHFLAGETDFGIAARSRAGGGVIGWLFSEGLTRALGLPAAIGMLLVIALLSVFAITGLSLVDLGAALASAWHWLRGTSPAPDGMNVNGQLPLGRSEPPLRRWWRRIIGWRPPKLRLPQPAILPPPSEPAPTPGRTATRTAPGRAPLSTGAPHIVGEGGQSWRLPIVDEILEQSSELDIQGEDLRRRAQIIESTLDGFGVPVQVVEANQGPAVTQFGLRPGTVVRRNRKGEEKRSKVRVSRIQALASDLSLALAASPIRIEAPVPGRDIVGVEVPNVQISLVALRGVMEAEEFEGAKGPLRIGLGRDVSGQAVVTDLTRMPHMLIAGATGSGKSVCVNAIITALLLTHTPDTLRFLMIDPKRVELTVYNGIPHLISPVVVDVERAISVLQWATREMERRYKLFAKASARNIVTYNEKAEVRGEQPLSYIVILIDELADLMFSAPDEVERYICRLAQMARATGIHLVIATQRPSVDVVTGLIKANFPARISFAVTSLIDSRVILDSPGAEQLLGRGDMLYMAPDSSKLQRLQGCFVSDRESTRLVRYWRNAQTLVEEAKEREIPADLDVIGEESIAEQQPRPLPQARQETVQPAISADDPLWIPGQEMLQQPLWEEMAAAEQTAADRDQMYDQAAAEVRRSGRASVSLLQRRLRIGYSRAARLIDQLEADGIVGPDLGGSRGREVLAPSEEADEAFVEEP